VAGDALTGSNMFAYCGNNPVMGSDPSGMAKSSSPVPDVNQVFLTDALTILMREAYMSRTNNPNQFTSTDLAIIKRYFYFGVGNVTFKSFKGYGYYVFHDTPFAPVYLLFHEDSKNVASFYIFKAVPQYEYMVKNFTHLLDTAAELYKLAYISLAEWGMLGIGFLALNLDEIADGLWDTSNPYKLRQLYLDYMSAVDFSWMAFSFEGRRITMTK